MNKFSLNKKIILVISISTLILSIILCLFIYFYLNNKLSNQKIEEISKLNIEQVHESTEIMNKYELFAKMLGTRTRVKEFLQERSEARKIELLGIFNDYIKDNTNYLAIYLLDTNGIGLVSTDNRFIDQDYSFRDYFKKAINGEPYVDFAIGKDSNQLGYYFSHPVFSNGKVIGVLVVKINKKEINEAITQSEVSKDSTVMLVDQYGIILDSNKKKRILSSLGVINDQNKVKIEETNKFLGKNIQPLQYDKAMRVIENYTKPEIVKFYDEEDGEDEMISVIKLKNLPSFLVSEIGMEDIENLVFSVIYIIILIIIFTILILMFFVYRFIISFLKPLSEFKILSLSIAGGDFSKKLNIKSNDEFEELANVFNNMTDKLRDSYSSLESEILKRTSDLENERGSLERKVMERTVELEELKNNLQMAVDEKTHNLNEKLEELEKMNKLMVDRELKMVEMKKALEGLKSENNN